MTSRIKTLWNTLDGERQESLAHARRLAAISKPYVLPPEGQTDSDRLPRPFQSLLSWGVTIMEGRLLSSLFPPDRPWFVLELDPSLLADTQMNAEELERVKQALYIRSLMVHAKLESADLSPGASVERRAGFRSRKRMALTQLLVTGDVLERLGDDYRLRVYRRDQYVTKRDSSGNVVCHIIRERLDPLGLSDEHRRACQFKDEELKEKAAHERMRDIYTLVEWQPQAKNWTVCQECNDHEFNESTETVTPYFSTPFELSGGDYGRGWIEVNEGDGFSFDEINEKILEFAGTASKHLWFIDGNSETRASDLTKPSGSVVLGRVSSGMVQDVAMMRADRLADFSVVLQTAERIRKDLGKAMLIESEAAPQGEAGRSPRSWERVAMELEGALGGLYAPIADEQQVPLLRRMMHQMKRDLDKAAIPDKGVQINIQTGIAALSRQARLGGVLQAVQAVQAFPEAIKWINLDVLSHLIFRLSYVDEPGLIKSPEQVKAEIEQQLRVQAQAQANEQMIQSAGAIAEQSAAQSQ